MLGFLQEFLVGEGFEFAAADSGERALALIRERRPDLMIVDVMMPGMTGLELCDLLRSDVASRGIPIIIHSAHEVEPHSSSGRYDAAFLKPCDPYELLWAIRALLPQKD